MTEQTGAVPEPVRPGKYARVERERRFLLAGPGSGAGWMSVLFKTGVGAPV
jgi:hypothetical protein